MTFSFWALNRDTIKYVEQHLYEQNECIFLADLGA